MGDNYSLKSGAADQALPLPEYAYQPRLPRFYRPKIGLIGCGGITRHHLEAYRQNGLDVVALCDINREAAESRRQDFFPEAEIFTDSDALLARGDIEVVDIALHVEHRVPVMEAALNAGKHILSQKPFVANLEEGRALVALAKEKNLKLAVNQNGRWAPYVRWMLLAIRDGLMGDVQSVNLRINWDHTWVKGTAFEHMRYLILFDFAVHWMDMARLFMGGQPARQVIAADAMAPGQEIGVPMMASVLINFERGGAVLDFDGHSRHLPEESFCIRGTKGTMRATGAICGINQIEVATADGAGRVDLSGSWFPDGFTGTMGELLAAIEEDREPENSARDNLKTLEVVYAAIASSKENQPMPVGSVHCLPQ